VNIAIRTLHVFNRGGRVPFRAFRGCRGDVVGMFWFLFLAVGNLNLLAPSLAGNTQYSNTKKISRVDTYANHINNSHTNK
jgi:hypothetical protein